MWFFRNKDRTYTLRLIMPQKTVDLIDALSIRTDSHGTKETIQRALALLDVVSQEKEKGGELFIRRLDGTESEIIIR